MLSFVAFTFHSTSENIVQRNFYIKTETTRKQAYIITFDKYTQPPYGRRKLLDHFEDICNTHHISYLSYSWNIPSRAEVV